MKHWKETKSGKIITNNDDYHSGRVLSIKMEEEGVRFREECDGCFHFHLSKQDAINMLQEAIEYIKKQ